MCILFVSSKFACPSLAFHRFRSWANVYASISQEACFFLTEIHIPNRISGINWVTKVAKNSSRPSVASLSFGGGFYASVNTVAANLVSSGVTTVVAAYNDGADAANYSPAGTLSVITVGASTIDDAKAYYSNYGPVLDL